MIAVYDNAHNMRSGTQQTVNYAKKKGLQIIYIHPDTAQLGKKGIKTAVIEKSPLMYGGTCINIGCIPTKKLIHTAADAKKNQK